MKTLQQNDCLGEDTETYLWEGKSAREVLKEAYHDNCTMKPLVQPRSNSTKVSRPTTYIVYDRNYRDECAGREDNGHEVGTLVELP